MYIHLQPFEIDQRLNWCILYRSLVSTLNNDIVEKVRRRDNAHPHNCDIDCLVRQGNVHNTTMMNNPCTTHVR